MSKPNQKNNYSGIGLTSLYLVLAFVSAFELFLVQPLIAKYILPWFGGTASVWTACLLFFQAALFVGYLYAFMISKVRIKLQITVHTLLIAVSLAAIGLQFYFWHIPLLPPHTLLSEDIAGSPTVAVLLLLTISVGLPYIMLASTSPMVQAWFYGAKDDQKKPIFFFYAVSNAGSLLSLLLYPFLLEPLLTLSRQAELWSLGYVIFAIACTASAIFAAKGSSKADAEESPRSHAPTAAISPYAAIQWLALSAVATILLIAFTNQICANVAPVPLLWLLPLAIYLISFILCFSSHATHIPTIAAVLMLPLTALILFITKHELQLGIIPQLAAYFITLFCGCMMTLGLLHKLRPATSKITFYYLMIALGGAIGGILVGIAAPIVFNDYLELRAILMVTTIICVWILRDKKWMSSWQVPLYISALTIIGLLTHTPQRAKQTVVDKSRGFYGALKVMREDQPHDVHVYSLMHGKICHGIQFDSGPLSRRPTAYFGPQSGIGIAFANHPKRKANADSTTGETDRQPMRVAVLGMGIGTVAAYAEKGDDFRFYELSPDVIRIATNTAWFTYLANCRGKAEIIPGDARISLEKELKENGPANYDIINMDAFNGDAIPVHLLTVEAFATYLKDLNPKDGVLAIQITNMYLDLVPVLAGIAEYYNLYGYVIEGKGDLHVTSDTRWVLLSRDKEYKIKVPAGAKVSRLDTNGKTILWTDDFSNILSVMKLKLFAKGRR